MADADYGLWPLVILNTLLFAVFGLSFFIHAQSATNTSVNNATRNAVNSPTESP